MATQFLTADSAAWATALANLSTLKAADLPLSRSSEYPGSPDATDLLAAAEVAVLDLHAPTISAVIDKLAMIWEFQLEGDSEDARHRRLVIGDLCRLNFASPV